MLGVLGATACATFRAAFGAAVEATFAADFGANLGTGFEAVLVAGRRPLVFLVGFLSAGSELTKEIADICSARASTLGARVSMLLM